MAEEELNSLTACDHLFYNYRKTEPYHYDCIKSITIKLNEQVDVVSISLNEYIEKKGRIIRIKRITKSNADNAFVLVFRMEDRSVRFSTGFHRLHNKHDKSRWGGFSLDEINDWLAEYNTTDIFPKTDFEDMEELSYTVRVQNTK